MTNQSLSERHSYQNTPKYIPVQLAWKLIGNKVFVIELGLSFLPEPSTDEERQSFSEKGARRFDHFGRWLTGNPEEPVGFQQRVQQEVTAGEGQMTNEPH